MPNPSRRAVSRAVCRAKTMPSSPVMGIWTSVSTVAALPCGAILTRDQAREQHLAFGRVQGSPDAAQLDAQLHQRERDGGTHPDDDRLGSHQARAGGDFADEPAEERIEHLDRGEIDQDAAGASFREHLREAGFQIERVPVVQILLDRRYLDYSYGNH